MTATRLAFVSCHVRVSKQRNKSEKQYMFRLCVLSGQPALAVIMVAGSCCCSSIYRHLSRLL